MHALLFLLLCGWCCRVLVSCCFVGAVLLEIKEKKRGNRRCQRSESWAVAEKIEESKLLWWCRAVVCCTVL